MRNLLRILMKSSPLASLSSPSSFNCPPPILQLLFLLFLLPLLVYPRLAFSSLSNLGWSQNCVKLLRAGLTSMCPHTWWITFCLRHWNSILLTWRGRGAPLTTLLLFFWCHIWPRPAFLTLRLAVVWTAGGNVSQMSKKHTGLAKVHIPLQTENFPLYPKEREVELWVL